MCAANQFILIWLMLIMKCKNVLVNIIIGNKINLFYIIFYLNCIIFSNLLYIYYYLKICGKDYL